MGVPKALEPTGVVFVDKPAGPSSFAMVAEVRRRTGAKTGHSGTLDPFATGLLILLSGRATSLQDRFMKLDKRYTTTIDLTCRSSTGDRDGDLGETHDPIVGADLEQALERLRGDVELPIPAASAVKIDGERAYKLHRRGVDVEMPTRVMQIHSLDCVEADEQVLQLELHVGSGTYIRSIADALGGHCVELRRTHIGPFGVDEADASTVVDLADVLPRLAGWATPPK